MAMTYFKRWSTLPPSPTPSLNDSLSSSSSSTISTPPRSPTPSSTTRLFSALKSSTTFPLSLRKASSQWHSNASSTTVHPHIPYLDNNASYAGSTSSLCTTTADPPATAGSAKQKSNDMRVRAWRRETRTLQMEYESLPLKRRREALERVNEGRVRLGLPRRSLGELGE
ncbi:hypothetical protein COCMIDRAFT_89389 [Bipolaris oryzae ATCC 44560]|uniref:Uncharacterized protein n=1 Tax=Bipolaris oryzae ATCC 44560 TaxID=930090 RepID=W6Z7M0_COCMI|nr:uncharacterized protein COCMIDRAFT_89389 [Bipolaris oryzae ATCC 44560]EUC47707.1 hypothetical protein COCMIDRAFT_89389 [Bipolaris oryzae ATCC 44560]